MLITTSFFVSHPIRLYPGQARYAPISGTKPHTPTSDIKVGGKKMNQFGKKLSQLGKKPNQLCKKVNWFVFEVGILGKKPNEKSM